MAFALPAIAAVGAVTSAVGTIAGGEAQSQAAAYQAQVAQNNATIARQNAKYAIAAGHEQAAITSEKGAATGGQIKADQAANGVDVNSGSALDVQESQRGESKLDTETALNNAQLTAYGYRSQAVGYEAQSNLDTSEAQSAPIGADLAAGGSLLSNASSIGFKWSGNTAASSG